MWKDSRHQPVLRGPPVEATGIVVLALIEPERLFIEITTKMKWFNADVGTLDGALKQPPEILDAIGVGCAIHILNGMIDNLMLVVTSETTVTNPCIGVDGRAGFDRRTNFRLKRCGLDVGDNDCTNAARLLTCLALQDTHNGRFTWATSSFDGRLTLGLVHVLRKTTDKTFVRLDIKAMALSGPSKATPGNVSSRARELFGRATI
jgi:hypothetical protein